MTIPDSVERVGDFAFAGCTALKELEFTEKSVLKSIGAGALKNCTELSRLVMPQSLESIGDEAFMGCSYLQNVIVPGSVKTVGARAFKNCTGFTNAQIEHGVESIGAEAFYGDWRITEVDIPSSVTNIGANAFGGDSSIVKASYSLVMLATDMTLTARFISAAEDAAGVGLAVNGETLENTAVLSKPPYQEMVARTAISPA